MAYTEFIAAIDLGTSRMVGMVGTKNAATGILSIIAYDTEDSAPSIRRGCVMNIEETAVKIKRLVKKLENKLNGARIATVYIGLGGQSIHSIDHSVIREVAEEEIVTEELKDLMVEECRAYQPKSLDVLGVVPPIYYINGTLEHNPVGVPYRKIEAKYKLIVGRPSLRRHIESCMERAQLKLADILISPLALADVVLSEDEKSLGCVLIDFGAGVTSVTIYKGGSLLDLCVIPLGGHLITKDLTTLHLVDAEAERLKITYGNAIVERDDDTTVQVNSVDGIGIREIKLAEVNYVIESRMKEITENVYALLEADDLIKSLGGGVIITGGASNLRNLAEEMQKRLKTEVRYAALRKNMIEKTALVSHAEFAVAIGSLMQGDMNCAKPVEQPVADVLFPDMEEERERERMEREKREKEKKEALVKEQEERAARKKRGFKDLFNKSIDKIGNLFDEDDMR